MSELKVPAAPSEASSGRRLARLFPPPAGDQGVGV